MIKPIKGLVFILCLCSFANLACLVTDLQIVSLSLASVVKFCIRYIYRAFKAKKKGLFICMKGNLHLCTMFASHQSIPEIPDNMSVQKPTRESCQTVLLNQLDHRSVHKQACLSTCVGELLQKTYADICLELSAAFA